jgi:flagellar biosynthesis protein
MKRRLDAVALAYGQLEAPVVTAKGSDELALAIIAEAKKQGVYIAQDRTISCCSIATRLTTRNST